MSDDNGDSWSPASLSSPDSTRLVSILAIDDDLIYTSTGIGIYSSLDAGASWVAEANGLPTPSWARSLLLGTDGFIYAGLAGGVYVKRDSVNWSAINNGLSDLSVNDLVQDADGVLFAATPSGVYPR